MKPKRIQRKRTKGWRSPEGTKYVGRGSKWGNPYCVVKMPNDWGWAVKCSADDMQANILTSLCHVDYKDKQDCAKDAVRCYCELLRQLPQMLSDIEDLRGHDLSCWCGESDNCHGDVLLKLANIGVGE